MAKYRIWSIVCAVLGTLAVGACIGPALADQPLPQPTVTYKKGDTVAITQAKVDVMVGAKLVGTVRKGETFDVLEARGDWLAIQLGDATGWIRSSVVERAKAPPAPPKPAPPDPAPPAPKPPRPEKGERYALLVGVKEYDATELKSLQYPEADMEALARLLPDLGYAPANTMVLTQGRGARSNRLTPTVAHIRKQLGLLLEEVRPEDTILIALAGHGVQFKGEDKSFFCPSDAKLDERSTLVPLDEIYEALQKSKAGGKVLLVDACRNDPQSALARSRSTVQLESVTRPQKRALPSSVEAYFSCSAGQQAFEHPDLKHGVFFHFLIEGLQGAADIDQDGEITLAEVDVYTTKQVQRYVRNELSEQQTPTRHGGTSGLTLLGRLSKKNDSNAIAPGATKDK